MKNVYIFTKEGRGFSTDGIEEIYRMLEEDCEKKGEEIDELDFVMGQFLNDRKKIIPELEKHAGNMYIIVSEDGGEIIHRFGLDGSAAMIDLLKHDPHENTWEALMFEIGEIAKRRAKNPE